MTQQIVELVKNGTHENAFLSQCFGFSFLDYFLLTPNTTGFVASHLLLVSSLLSNHNGILVYL
jgi:hypothetical protein